MIMKRRYKVTIGESEIEVSLFRFRGWIGIDRMIQKMAQKKFEPINLTILSALTTQYPNINWPVVALYMYPSGPYWVHYYRKGQVYSCDAGSVWGPKWCFGATAQT